MTRMVMLVPLVVILIHLCQKGKKDQFLELTKHASSYENCGNDDCFADGNGVDSADSGAVAAHSGSDHSDGGCRSLEDVTDHDRPWNRE